MSPALRGTGGLGGGKAAFCYLRASSSDIGPSFLAAVLAAEAASSFSSSPRLAPSEGQYLDEGPLKTSTVSLDGGARALLRKDDAIRPSPFVDSKVACPRRSTTSNGRPSMILTWPFKSSAACQRFIISRSLSPVIKGYPQYISMGRNACGMSQSLGIPISFVGLVKSADKTCHAITQKVRLSKHSSGMCTY